MVNGERNMKKKRGIQWVISSLFERCRLLVPLSSPCHMCTLALRLGLLDANIVANGYNIDFEYFFLVPFNQRY